MIGVLRSHVRENDDGGGGDDYSVDLEYSIGLEYTGPPVSFDIPRIAPVDVRRVPVAAVAARAALPANLDIPVVRPFVPKGGKAKNRLPDRMKPDTEASASRVLPLTSGNSGGIDSSFKAEGNGGDSTGDGDRGLINTSHGIASHEALGVSESRISDAEDFEAANGALARYGGEPSNRRSPNLSEVGEEHVTETKREGHRATVTFLELPLNDSESEISDHHYPEMTPERAVVHDGGRKGLCHKCGKRNRFAERDTCIVCGAKYCSSCVLRAMGSMPEGRKCITCIGFRINELNRRSLGKCSRMLRKLLTHEAVQQIMDCERSCDVNQPPPHLVFVNGRPLSVQELVMLQSCHNPPKKLKPGRYWYDKVCGFWGQEGEKPCQIISAQLDVGDPLREDASNGTTNVKINNREITKAELHMLKAAGIHCEGNPHFWVVADGSCQHEGMNNVVGKLWEKKRMKLICAALSLPYPSNDKRTSAPDAERGSNDVNSYNHGETAINKLLLLGGDQSGTSTIFKQARILYDVPFSDDEKQDLKNIIQRNLYKYIAILLEGRRQFEREYEASASDPGPSDEKKILSFSPRLEAFASELLEMTSSGNLEAIFPAATREYSPLVEELWKDKSFQTIYQRRNEIKMLPDVAGYFLEKAVEISRVDYEPHAKDILYAEGISSSNGVALLNFSLPITDEEALMESDQHKASTTYQLIRVNTNSLGEKCKFLQFFEGVDLVIFCASLTDYDEYFEDEFGVRTNKMMATKKLFETIVTHPTLAEASFLLIFNKFDLDEKLKEAPLQECDWFHDFIPVIGHHPGNINGNNSPLGVKAFHHIAVKFKRLFTSLTDQKLFVSRVSELSSVSVDDSLRFCTDILKWEESVHRHPISLNEWSTESFDQSLSA